MKREEIEQLLADYASGEISSENRQRLEEMFEQDASLNQEANEMAAIWQELNAIEEQPSATMDKQFYAMLQNAAGGAQSKGARIIQINTSWVKTATAIAACILMFVIGRFTASPLEVIKYKTLLVKQPVINTPQFKPEPVLAVRHPVNNAIKPHKEININDKNAELEQQLRSVYASERIDAVMKLSAQKNLSEDDLKLLEMALTEDANANVRLTVINALRPLINIPNVQQVLISGLNRQDDLLVQSSLVDVLVSAKSKLAVPQLLTLLDNKNTNAMVQNKIKGGIESFLN